uniref:Uncharacterized protein n=1 Tax=Romanomermis culicivorax TaxID=13658 RepID=A0A915L7K6_ROMCU
MQTVPRKEKQHRESSNCTHFMFKPKETACLLKHITTRKALLASRRGFNPSFVMEASLSIVDCFIYFVISLTISPCFPNTTFE